MYIAGFTSNFPIYVSEDRDARHVFGRTTMPQRVQRPLSLALGLRIKAAAHQ